MRFFRVLKRRYRLAVKGIRQVAAGGAPPPLALPPATTVVHVTEKTRYFYLGPDIALTRLATGHLIYVDPLDEGVSAHLIVHGFWEAGVQVVVQSLVRPGARVIDVGANVGYYTLLLAQAVGPEGTLVALEPNARMVGLVQRSLAFNGYGWVRLLPAAAADRSGTLSFMTSRRWGASGHTLVPESFIGDDGEITEVKAVRLDDLGLDSVDLIRIDAEGSEPLVLRGATRLLQNPDIVVCMEWSVVQMRSRVSVPEFIDWLIGLGFRFWKIEPNATLSPMSIESLMGLDHCDVVMSRSMPKLT